MSGKWKTKRSPIGLDLGTSGFKLIQGGWNDDVWTATSASVQKLPLDLPKEKAERTCLLKERLAGALAAGSFRGREVVSSLPMSMWQCKSLRLPPMPRDELKTAVEWEAADRLHLGANHYVQFYDAGEVQQGEEVRREVIVLAMAHEVVDEHVDVLASCGLAPVAIDVAPSALATALATRDGADSENAVQFTLDVGAEASKVVISRHGRVLFFKSIEIGVRQLEEAISTALKVPVEDTRELRIASGGESNDSATQAVADATRPLLTDLAREVGLCLRYYSVTFRGIRPESLVVTGGGASTHSLIDRLAQEIGIETVPFVDLPQFDFKAITERAAMIPTSCWTVATGLALRPLTQQANRGAA